MSYGPSKETLKIREMTAAGSSELEAVRSVLTPKQFNACTARLAGASLKDCVKASMTPVGFKRLKSSPKFNQGLTEDKVFNTWQRRYMELAREEAEKKSLMTAVERRKFCADVVRAAPGDLGEGSHLVQSYEVRDLKGGGQATRMTMPNKLQAIQLDAELAGELKGQGSDPQVNIALMIGRLPDTSRIPGSAAAQLSPAVNVALAPNGDALPLAAPVSADDDIMGLI